jgi:uncharacterized phage protein gp47/JayE
MPWSTPTLREVRSLVRDALRASLPGADASVPNSVLRVLSDNQGALCHLTLQYIDWLALQLLPDTAETEWLDRHGKIWLVNADGTTGRKLATLATGRASFTATVDGVIIPIGTILDTSVSIYPLTGGVSTQTVSYETTEAVYSSIVAPVEAPVRALDPGVMGNLPDGTSATVNPPIGGVSSAASLLALTGGTDDETDEELRIRILRRIQQPPMGGAAYDYEAWALAVPGVTRAWCSPLEMGIGTVTVRFMMDDLRADNNGFPTGDDVLAVKTYLDEKRPVAVKDSFVEAPIPQPIDIKISNLVTDSPSTHAAIEQQLEDMLYARAYPGATIYRSWVEDAISQAPGVDHYDLDFENTPAKSLGHLAILGTVTYG